MKLLIQHRHNDTEISGVMTYINLIVPALQAKGVQVKVTSTKTSSLKNWLPEIAWADVVHMNSNHLGFALACKALGKKIVIKYHYSFYQSTHTHYQSMTFGQRLKRELIESLPKSNYPLKWKLYTGVKWARLGIRLATAFVVDERVACSKFLAESHAFPMSVSTLYNPICLDRDLPPKTLADLAQPYTFVFVGRLSKDKGSDILLKAAALLQQRGKEFQILFVGEGGESGKLKQITAELKLLQNVKFLGKVPYSEVFTIVWTALALVAPSRWQEPAGYVALEAATVQTCPIVSRMGGLLEMVGEQGFSFENENVEALAEIMIYCLENPDEALIRGVQVSEYVAKNFAPERTAIELIDVCQNRRY